MELRRIPEAPDYSITADGRVFRTAPWGDGRKTELPFELTTQKPDRYWRVNVTVDGKDRGFLLARLVLSAWVGPAPDGAQAAHFDGNPSNNNVSNLRWATPKENAEDRA